MSINLLKFDATRLPMQVHTSFTAHIFTKIKMATSAISKQTSWHSGEKCIGPRFTELL